MGLPSQQDRSVVSGWGLLDNKTIRSSMPCRQVDEGCPNYRRKWRRHVSENTKSKYYFVNLWCFCFITLYTLIVLFIAFSYRATVEIGRYQSHMAHVHDRFMGYHITVGNCKYHETNKECFHIKMENGSLDTTRRMYAFQLGNL